MKNKLFLAAVVATLSLAQVKAADPANSGHSDRGAVFVMTNAANKNQVLSYRRHADGTLAWYGAFSTGGRGSGGTTDPLGSQGSLTLSQDRSVLLAVNAGSGELSSFLVNGPKLELVDVKLSGGSAPVSVAQWGSVVYVLNFAGNSSVVGFWLEDGRLTPIPNSIRYLSTANAGASSVVFSPDGRWLVVTEKLTNNIDTFAVSWDGMLGSPVLTKDPTAGLFDATFAPTGLLLSLEAGSGTVSSFIVDSTGILTSIDAGVPTLGAASCWIVLTPDGRYVYTSNAGSSNISGFSLNGSGSLTAIGQTIVGSNPPGSTNLDLAISEDGKFLYGINSGKGTIGIFAIRDNGTLQALVPVSGLPAGVGFNGIAAL